jgi:DNA-binding CsgD family transcriptional regulator
MDKPQKTRAERLSEWMAARDKIQRQRRKRSRSQRGQEELIQELLSDLGSTEADLTFKDPMTGERRSVREEIERAIRGRGLTTPLSRDKLRALEEQPDPLKWAEMLGRLTAAHLDWQARRQNTRRRMVPLDEEKPPAALQDFRAMDDAMEMRVRLDQLDSMLSPKDRRILSKLMLGKTHAEAAQDLGLKEHDIENASRRIKAKARSR